MNDKNNNKLLIILPYRENSGDKLIESDLRVIRAGEYITQSITIGWVRDKLAEHIAESILPIAQAYTHIIAAGDTFGKNFMPRLAGLLNISMISDVIDIQAEDKFIRNIYAGNARQIVKSLDNLKLLTIRSTAFELADQSSVKEYKIINISSNNLFNKTKFMRADLTVTTRPDLLSAKIIIAGGRGLQSKENFKLLTQLADELNAAIGATRAAVDAEFMTNDFQIGQTGKIVAPEIYIAIGISGAIQHLSGIKDSKLIIAINKDPEAPIFSAADYGLIGDLFEIVPELIQKLKNKKNI